MRIRGSAIIFLALVLILSFGPGLAQSGDNQPGESRYYPQTGHTVSGPFLSTYLSVPNPVQIFGYPITDPFPGQLQDNWVQYFERARFELITGAGDEVQVHISHLGYLMQKTGTPIPLPANFPPCLTFVDVEFDVCYAFRDFFEANGGAAIFGYPMSDFQVVDQRIVQYFQRARFEWHPDRPPGQMVTLTPLGRIYFYQMEEDTARLLPNPSTLGVNNLLQSVLSLNVQASTKTAVSPQSGEQTIFVLVQDQNLQAIPNAEVELVILLPSGDEQRIIIPGSTDKNGVTSYTFDFENETIGLTEINVSASFDALTAKTTTSFRIWY
jgi:hypothetical protein